MTRRRLIFWILGPLILLALNLARDLSRLQSRYEWERSALAPLHRGVSTSGVMEALRVMEIKSEVDETVEKKFVEEGQAVKAGDLLLQLSRSRTQLEFEQKKNSFGNIEADYRKAVRELAVQRKLLKSLAVSRQQVEDAQQAVGKSLASLQISTRELALVQKKLDSTQVRSPMDGVVLRDFTKLGAGVGPGKDILIVGDISKFLVRAKVDELDINQVKVGQSADILADAFPGVVMKGRVVSIASQAERETFAKVEVVIEITDAADLQLKHNLSVRVNIVTEEIPDCLSVPIKSVVKKEGDIGWIIVRNAARLVSRRRVKLGVIGADRVQVLSGLAPGEFVGTEKASDDAP